MRGDEVSGAPRVTAPTNQNVAVRTLRRVCGFVKTQWQRTSLFVLIVVVFSAVIAFRNYQLQLKSSEPQLVSAGPAVTLVHPVLVYLDLRNIGKRPAQRIAGTLFSFSEAHTRGQKLADQANADQDLPNADHILPEFNGTLTFKIEGEAPDLFLACLKYFDGKTPLQQAFVYRLERRDIPPSVVDEIETPDYGEVCN
jgi:hypothetical protein